MNVWAAPDPYAAILSDEHVNAALQFFTGNKLDCSVQSPWPRDVIQTQDGGVKVRKVSKQKRYMTISICETYELFRTDHPNVQLVLAKFYSLRPEWVSIGASREQCVCVYRADLNSVLSR